MTQNKLKKYAILIPLRGGSKGIPKKNIYIINKIPLFGFVTKSAINTGCRTYISTDDNEIKDKCKNLYPSAKIIDRPKHLALDSSSTEEVINHFIKEITSIEHIILLQATSPLTKTEEIKRAINLYIYNNFIPLVSVVKEHSFYWDKNGQPINYDPFNRPRRQDWDGVYKENGAIYIFSIDHFKKHQCRADKICTLFEMNSQSSIEVDSKDDLKLIEYILKNEIKSNY